MKEALTRLLSSAKVRTAILGMVTTAGASLFARYGIDLSTEAVQQVAITVSSMFGILLATQGAADLGKHAALTTTTVTPAAAPPTTIATVESPAEVS